MIIKKIIDQVNSERLYQHILKVEGIKHPIDAPERLNEVADYIRAEFEKYGLTAGEQTFRVEGFDLTFRNIEGTIGDGAGSELLIVSHYDTVFNSPGANDNGTGIACMLEAARVLAQEKAAAPNLRFVSFTLEELNPNLELRARNSARDLGLIDNHNRYTSLRVWKLMKHHSALRQKALTMGKNIIEAWTEATDQLKDQLSEHELKYVESLQDIYGTEAKASWWVGKTAVVGSSSWVKEALRAKMEVLGVLNLETVGYTSSRKHSQRLPNGIDPKMFPSHGVDEDAFVGNFLAIVSDANSAKLAQSFCKQCKLESIDLPYVCFQVPLHFEEIAQNLRDMLRSDHAPFWRAGIPGLMLTDTANFRYPYYHTMADTIDKLDFDFVTKVCQATVATAIDFSTE